MPSRALRRAVLALVPLLAAMPAERGSAAEPDASSTGCPPPREQDGEARLVFLGDSGFAQGSSEWGAHGQEAIAARIKQLRLAPDLVFFLGDNIYWHGSAELYKSRFDDMYDPLVRQCKAHAALGNHDLKGCRTIEGPELPADATAYQDLRPGARTCNAAAALAHEPFGFGSVETGDPPARRGQRYYSVSWPTPTPLVDVILLDSNTLKVHEGLFQDGKGQPREDRSQLLWLRNALARETGGPEEEHRTWKLVALHHPPNSPEGCPCRLFGWCPGRHGDQSGLRDQLASALEGLEPPDMVLAGHNHLYARSHPLDASGQRAEGGSRGVRYFVTGGGGAPLYAVVGEDPRWAKALSIHHFVYLRLTASSAFFWVIDEGGRVKDAGCFDKGSNVEQPLAGAFGPGDPLPPRCAPPRRVVASPGLVMMGRGGLPEGRPRLPSPGP